MALFILIFEFEMRKKEIAGTESISATHALCAVQCKNCISSEIPTHWARSRLYHCEFCNFFQGAFSTLFQRYVVCRTKIWYRWPEGSRRKIFFFLFWISKKKMFCFSFSLNPGVFGKKIWLEWTRVLAWLRKIVYIDEKEKCSLDKITKKNLERLKKKIWCELWICGRVRVNNFFFSEKPRTFCVNGFSMKNT